MSASRTRPEASDVLPQQPQVAPPQQHLHANPDFTLQLIMELQKSVGEMNANLVAMKGATDSVKSKVDDLIGWKNKILGGAAVLGAVCALLGIVLAKATDYVQLKGTTPAAVTAPAVNLPVPAAVAK